ncbi:hypothetical protein CYLTODRAFT_460090 [Cylindrobasidium torrendii FP15055 ss-10]|uniref:Uncharacterized protein n=1 Tax=Cylindrobasidium torrendii FP15055 ss-10 TaxID=1314674 RepID=A0A0D7AV47_9AGAR|nr:hypothetical protein CYLTODRAFT_460090 [Cylindrobasidium torrendii FP15055 ss-10]
MSTMFESSPPQWQGADEQYPEGRLGARFGPLVVSTPNATVMYAPLYDQDVALRMREGCHFGIHDPFSHPQPHHGPTRHLMCVPAPTDVGKNAILFFNIQAHVDWEPRYGDGAVTGLGRVRQELVDALVERGTQLSDEADLFVNDVAAGKIPGVASEVPSARISKYRWYLKFYLRAVAQEGSFDDCELRWSNARRIQLEICAYIKYFRVYCSLFHELPLIPRPTDTTLMGCITNNYVVAAEVYSVGLPVWFVYKAIGSRRSHFRRFLSEQETQNLLQASSIPPRPVQMGEAAPNHHFLSLRRHPHALLLWQGKADDVRRFAVMTEVCRGEKQAVASHTPPAGPNPPSSSTPTFTPLTTVTPAPPPVQRSTSKRTRVDSTGGPSKKAKTRPDGGSSTASGSPNAAARSRFDEPLDQRQVLPAPIQPLLRALQTVKQELNLHPNARPTMANLPGLKPHYSGFVVPDGSQIASMSVVSTQAGALVNSVRFQPLWHYRARSIMSPIYSVELVKAQVWRSAIGLDVIGHSTTTQDTKSTTRKRQGPTAQEKREAALDTLNQTMEASGIRMSLKSGDLRNSRAVWRGTAIEYNTSLPSLYICRCILWELYELNFRAELILADYFLYDWDKEAQKPASEEISPGERRVLLCEWMEYWQGDVVPDASVFCAAPNGFASPNREEHVRATLCLLKVMAGWTGIGELPANLEAEGRRVEAEIRQATDAEINRWEEAVWCHYIRVYFKVFGRPPTTPRTMPARD